MLLHIGEMAADFFARIIGARGNYLRENLPFRETHQPERIYHQQSTQRIELAAAITTFRSI
jgi:hypothetical protein